MDILYNVLKTFFIFSICLIYSSISYAQTSVLIDTTGQKLEEREFIPKVATASLLSAALPGAGQFYNKKHWYIKIPIIYAGGISLGLLIDNSQKNYKLAKNSFIARTDENPTTVENSIFASFSDKQLLEEKAKFKRSRNFYTALTVLWYFINVGDAASTAQTFNRKIELGENYVLRLRPASNEQILAGMTLSIGYN
jgi:hypothetical protein